MKKWLQFGKDQKKNGPSFEVPLNELIERDRKSIPKTKIPLVLANILKNLQEESRLKEEGILRLSGPTKQIKAVRELLDKDPQADLISYDTMTLGDVLKMFLRSLPEAIIPSALISQFMAAGDSKKLLMDAVDELPDVNYYCLKEVLGLCKLIGDNRDVNKMTWPNLTLVMTPNIFKGDGMADNMRMSTCVHSMMVHYSDMFDDVHEDDDEDEIEGPNSTAVATLTSPTAKTESNRESTSSTPTQATAPYVNGSQTHMGGFVQAVLDEISEVVSEKSSSVPLTPVDQTQPLTPKEILSNVKQRKSIDIANAELAKTEVATALSNQTEQLSRESSLRARNRAVAAPTVPEHIVVQQAIAAGPIDPREDLVDVLPSLTKSRPRPPSLQIKREDKEVTPDRQSDPMSPKSILKQGQGGGGVNGSVTSSLNSLNSPQKNVRFQLPSKTTEEEYSASEGVSDTEQSLTEEEEEGEDDDDTSEASDGHWDADHGMSIPEEEIIPDPEVRINPDEPEPETPLLNLGKKKAAVPVKKKDSIEDRVISRQQQQAPAASEAVQTKKSSAEALNKSASAQVSILKSSEASTSQPASQALSIVTDQTVRLQNIGKILTTPLSEPVSANSQADSPMSSRASTPLPTKGVDTVFQVAKAKVMFWRSKNAKSASNREEPAGLSPIMEVPSPTRPTRDPPTNATAGKQQDNGNNQKSNSSLNQVSKTTSIGNTPANSENMIDETIPKEELPRLPSLSEPPIHHALLGPILNRANIQIREYGAYLKFVKMSIQQAELSADEQAKSVSYYQKEKKRLRIQIERYRALKQHLVEQTEFMRTSMGDTDDVHEKDQFNFLKREKHILKKEIKRLKDETLALNAITDKDMVRTNMENIKMYYDRYNELKQLFVDEKKH